jgi:tetratricopeptide (TPR) repeat protein
MIRHGLTLLVKPLENRKGIFHRIAPGAMIVILIIIPFLTYGAQFKNRPEYPFTQVNLPVGVVKFLNEMNAGGSILNEPNSGGYHQWALNKTYKIYMDMELAIFNDRDFAYVNNALFDENTFRSFIGKYDPSFISVSLKRSYFPNFIRQFKDFRLVFFDDTEALYVNAKHFKHIAESYELKHIDPFQYISINYDSETKERLSLILDEAMKLKNLYQDCLITNAIIANIQIADKQYEKALPYVDAIILRYPDVTNGYALKADALFGLERFKDAAALYRTAIDKGNMVNMDHVHFLYTAYIRLNEHNAAYRVLSGAINPFNAGARYQDIYKLGMSAAAAGKVRDAVNFLKIAEMKLPPGDAEYVKKIKDAFLMLDPEGKQMFKQ